MQNSRPVLDTAPFLLRDPSISATQVAFSYGGSIWIATRDGSDLRQISSAGRESKPRLSPDGKLVAFIGEYGGPRGVFLTSSGGGEAQRVTWHPDDFGSVGLSKSGNSIGWAHDGSRILFSSRRAAFAGGASPVVQLFTVAVGGGNVAPVPLVRAAEGALSPDGRQIAYVANTRTQAEWKGYRGGQATSIRVADLASSSIDFEIPSQGSNDFNPVWVGETIYFLSDRSGPVTIFAYDLEGGSVRQVVEGAGLDIKSASGCADAIAYEKFGALHVLDLRTGKERQLDLRPVADFPEARSQSVNLGSAITSLAPFPEIKPTISPTGEHAIFGVRGRLLRVSADDGEASDLGQCSGVSAVEPAWSADGSALCCFSNDAGEFGIQVLDPYTNTTRYKIALDNPRRVYSAPLWSPDGHKIAYQDKQLNTWCVDITAKTPLLVDKDLHVDPPTHNWLPNAARQMAWSPDSRWIAYTKVLENHLHAIFVYSVEEGKSRQLTDGMSDTLYVAFDASGHYLYFSASTDVGLAAGSATSSFGRQVSRSIYALVLQLGGPSPLARTDDGSSHALHCTASERVQIDFADVARRIVRLPLPAKYYVGLFAGKPGSIFYVDGVREGSSAQALHRFDLDTGRTEQIVEDVTYLDLSPNGSHLLYARTSPDQSREWFIGPSHGKLSDAQAKRLKVDPLNIIVEPKVEWEQIYEEAWRTQRRFLYDPNLHGIDLERLHETYRPFLQNIVTREDLDYLLAEALANIGVSHLWVASPPVVEGDTMKIGLLGADYEVESGRFRFKRVYDADPWNALSRAPLRESGREVHVGEFLLAIDGREILASADLGSYFESAADKSVVLRVGPKADGSGARDVPVKPVASEYSLRYFAWIEANRRNVDALSKGRLAYVHLPDCQATGYRDFNRYFFAQVGKEGVILDVRYNFGGSFPDYFIDCLRRPLMCHWDMGEGADLPSPLMSIFGPKVMLINEMSVSMGEVLPWMFRRAGLGPLVGRRTWGGSIGAHTYVGTVDGGVVLAPNLAFYAPDGTREIENVGVLPDVDVAEDPMAALAGDDLQLMKAVEVGLELLATSPASSTPARRGYSESLQ